MADVTAKLVWQKELSFVATSRKGSDTLMSGGEGTAPSPMDLLLEALGGCTAIDMVLILEKMREPLKGLTVHMEGDRRLDEAPKFYTGMRVQFDLFGYLSADKVERAIQLSFSKYCSVYHSLRQDLMMEAAYRINPEGADPAGEWKQVALRA